MQPASAARATTTDKVRMEPPCRSWTTPSREDSTCRPDAGHVKRATQTPMLLAALLLMAPLSTTSLPDKAKTPTKAEQAAADEAAKKAADEAAAKKAADDEAARKAA